MNIQTITKTQMVMAVAINSIKGAFKSTKATTVDNIFETQTLTESTHKENNFAYATAIAALAVTSVAVEVLELPTDFNLIGTPTLTNDNNMEELDLFA